VTQSCRLSDVVGVPAQDALASLPNEAPTDAMLAFANALNAALADALDEAGSMGKVNRVLREFFTEFRVVPQSD